MTDAVQTVLIGAGVTIITTAIGVVGSIVIKKLDLYRTEVNGHMHTLIETTKKLGEKTGADDNQARTDAKKQSDK